MAPADMAGATAARWADPGYHLIAEGRPTFERAIGFRPSPRLRLGRFHIRLGIAGYLGAMVLTTTGLMLLALWALAFAGCGPVARAWAFLFGFVPATEAASAVVNRAVARPAAPCRCRAWRLPPACRPP